MKDVDLGEPTSFLDNVYLGCTQRECQISKDIVDNCRHVFESRISDGAMEKLPEAKAPGKPDANTISPWSYDMEGQAKKCAERYCELANRTTQQFCKVATPCLEDHHYNEEEKGSVGEFSTVCAQIVLKCLYLARIGRPDILWSVNQLARAVTKWTKACDKCLARLISYIHHTSEFRGNTPQQCRIGSFQDSDFAGDVEDSKSTSGELSCIFGSQTFVPPSWMCKKQILVSRSSTEAERISLDAGLRMDGIPALDLWDLVKEVFHSSPTQSKETKDQARGNSLRDTTSNKNTQNQTEVPIQHDTLELSNVDYVSSNAKSSLFCAGLYVFEDNEAVIKMTIKGRSPTMRHVSITHRVALDWLFDRINLDPKIQHTKHQLADILTKDKFTRDEWKNLLHLFNISHFSSTCCAKNCGKIKTSSDELVFNCSGKFLIREKSDYVLRSGETHKRRETGKQDEKKFET